MSDHSEIKYINPSTLFDASRHFSQIVEVKGGRLVFIAGQAALDRNGKLVGAGDFSAQVTQVFENLKEALLAVGADFTNLVKLQYFITDMTQVRELVTIRDTYLNGPHRPVGTLVGVNSLPIPHSLIEVEAVAVVPE